MNFSCIPFGDSGILIQFETKICESINRKVTLITSEIEKKLKEEIIEVVPSYSNLLVIYDPLKNGYFQLIEKINSIKLDTKTGNGRAKDHEVINIPVCYEGDFGIDIEYVAKCNNLTVKEVISIHSKPNYLIYMLGFTPGFPYLGGMSSKISTQRLESPRVIIPSGSVGIAGNQTGIYPIDSPGGWRIIGRTPFKLFEPRKNPPVLLKAGKYLKFHPISFDEYKEFSNKVAEDG